MNDSPLKIGTKVPTAIYTASDEPVCIVDSMKERTDDAQVARRLVACWNACQGLSTLTLEKIGAMLTPMQGIVFGALGNEFMQTEKQRDELLAALRQVRDLVDAYGSEDDNNAVGNAIAKCEGGGS